MGGTRAVVVCAIASAIACGESTSDSPKPADAAADKAPIASGGNSAVGGFGGFGGNGASGAFGATAGFGGTPLTGGAPSDAAPDVAIEDAACPPVKPAGWDAARESFCAAAVPLPCSEWGTEAQCASVVDGVLSQVSSCCFDELVLQLQCGADSGLRCGKLTNDLLWDPACASVEEAFDVCTGDGDNCSVVGKVGGGGCQVECDQYAADCNATDAGDGCVCTFGPHSGKNFTIPSFGCDTDAVRAACK